jgi:hypothetical protein
MHVILGYLHRINLYVMVRCDLTKYLGDSLLDVASQNPFAVLRSPHKMVLRIVDRMAGAFYRHICSLLHDAIHCNSAIMADSSPATGRGILRPFS